VPISGRIAVEGLSYYVIIRGPLGVGKSTISKKLAKALKACYISIDALLHEYGLDVVSEDEECIPANNFIRATEMILPDVIGILGEGKIVILDGCFYHREQIDHLLRNLPELHYAFNLRATLRTCIERDGGRKKAYGADAAAVVHYLVSRFDYGIDIDTEDKTEGKVVKEILSHLPTR
jgi:adenylate kinase family enzyme